MYTRTEKIEETFFLYFIDEFEKYYKHMDPMVKKGLREAAPLVFAKWYHTALVSDTILSPANIWAQQHGDTDCEPAYILRMQKGGRGRKKYQISYLPYTIETHPLLLDLKQLADYCEPDCTVDQQGYFFEQDAEKLLPQLTYAHGYYLEYLIRLAKAVGIVEAAPAIHTHKICKGRKYDDFFAQDPKIALQTLLQEACSIAAERFIYCMELEPGMVDRAYFMHYLKESQSTEEFFIDFYKMVDVDLQNLMQRKPEEMTEEEQALASSFLFLGMMAEQWFFFPLSVFFRVIRPLNFLPIQFYQLINDMATLCVMGQHMEKELFSPATYYSLTTLGNQLIENSKKMENAQKMPPDSHMQDIFEAIESQQQIFFFQETMRKQTRADVGVFHIYMEKDIQLWKEVEIPLEFPLHLFCEDVILAFDMEQTGEYLLSVPNENGFPVEYTGEGSKRAINKTSDLCILDLQPTVQSQWTLLPTQEIAYRMCIEIVEIKSIDPYLTYPRVRRQSKQISALERMYIRE